MFLFLSYYVAAVTNKFPRLPDIKGFLILITVLVQDVLESIKLNFFILQLILECKTSARLSLVSLEDSMRHATSEGQN